MELKELEEQTKRWAALREVGRLISEIAFKEQRIN